MPCTIKSTLDLINYMQFKFFQVTIFWSPLQRLQYPTRANVLILNKICSVFIAVLPASHSAHNFGSLLLNGNRERILISKN
jgi:hypothetical protein